MRIVPGGASYTRTGEIATIIIYEIYGKKYQLDFELNAVLHFNFQNHFYL
jgi:hypothetical protein